MGLLGALLDRLRGRKAAPPTAKTIAPRPVVAPVEPMDPVAPASPAPKAAAAAVTPAASAAPATPPHPLTKEELERKALLHSFAAGILDPRFKEIDVDHRFLEDFAKLLESGHDDFAVPPAAAFDVMRIVDDAGYPVKKVAAAIACDPTLAGAVLSLANSALHRGAVPVETLPNAIVRLGQKHLRLLLLEIALHSTRVKAKPYETFSTLTWKHSLLTAQLSVVLAGQCGVDADHAYMAGLFHDVGTFAALTAARSLASRQTRRITAQTLLKVIDAHGTALNERVVARWRLPEAVGKAVVHRLAPHEAGDAARLAALVALANDLSRPLGAWVPKRPIDFGKHAGVEVLKLDPARLPDEATILELALKIERVAGLK
jgi:HD-like signal output (HDOD) protein